MATTNVERDISLLVLALVVLAIGLCALQQAAAASFVVSKSMNVGR